MGGGRYRTGAVDSPPCWNVGLNWPRASQWTVMSTYVEFFTKGSKGLFPLPGPQNGRRATFLCGWILGSQLVKRSNFLSQRVRQGNCPLTQGGSCQNKHIRDNVSQLVFSLLFLLYLFPTSPIRHFLSSVCQQQHSDRYFRHKTLVWMNKSTWQSIWKQKRHHKAVSDLVLHTVCEKSKTAEISSDSLNLN